MVHQRAVPIWVQHWFTRTPSQPGKNFPHSMYHMHRSSLDPLIQEIRRGRDYDYNIFSKVFDPEILDTDAIHNCIVLSNSGKTHTFVTLIDDKAIRFANFENVDTDIYAAGWEFRTERL